MQASSHFLTLARHHLWATERVLNAVQNLSDADYRRDVGLFFHSIHGTLNHLLVVEHQLWWQRLTCGESPHVDLRSTVHEERALVDVQMRSLSARWQSWVPNVSATHWSSALRYLNLRGDLIEVPVTTALTHVFQHAVHHRGQITAALTHLGAASPELDLIYYLQGSPSFEDGAKPIFSLV